MIKKILIANRGEIACRIIKTAKKMSIETIALFSDSDRNALHVHLADHAIYLGPSPSQQSYLNRQKIMTIAKEYAADAIHPGYGFLAEDSEFSDLCAKNQIIFIGPNASCIKSMGDKSLAKQLMQKAHVPTIPGYQGEDQTEKTLKKEAAIIGYPILIKAAAGGGGKGMRLVKQEKDFVPALQEAQQEALASFGSDRVLLEKYLNPARHIEVQIFADHHGNAVYLFDRECSIQRRHQKIVEEAPAPLLSNELREKMGQAAVRAAQAIKYSGAGTLEFLLDAQQNFYFMEMNTRLQVEHAVTEMITQQDLVEWQIKVAQGERLPLLQPELRAHGHAIEARICAENPDKDFIPSTGKLTLLHFPTEQPSVRIDSGVTQNDTISPYYDSMIAKLIVWAETRTQAAYKLAEQLAKTYIIGVETNLSLLSRICHSEEFQKALLSTEFIKHHAKKLLPQDDTLPTLVVAAAIAAEWRWRQEQGQHFALQSDDAHSPWFIRDNWRLNATTLQQLRFWYRQQSFIYYFQFHENKIEIKEDTVSLCIEPTWLDEFTIAIEMKNEISQVAVFHQQEVIYVFYAGISYALHVGHSQQIHHSRTSPTSFVAPMPSMVVEVAVTNGQKVSEGEKIMVLEAMKMRHVISAPEAGIVKEIYFKKGDLLNEGDTLLSFEP